jgi:hypothetical protein
MARLTSFSRLLIALLVVGGVYFAVTKLLPKFSLGSEQTETSTSTPSTEEATAPATDNNRPTAATAAFEFRPADPVSGKLKGVVELGATGFNSFIVRIDQQGNWKLEKADYGASLVYENMTSDADVKDGLKQYISEMVAYGVAPRDIHFVISSGAKKVAVTDQIIKTLTGMKYYVNTVTPEQEGQYALKCVLPKAYSGRAFVVDIGSGNTKVSWKSAGQVKAFESFGSKYSQNGTNASDVRADLKSKSAQIPSSLTSTCFIIGGVPFEFAKKVRNGKERYTVLPAPEAIKASGDKQVNGLTIYQSIAESTGCKQFVFDWDANFTIGFLLSL